MGSSLHLLPRFSSIFLFSFFFFLFFFSSFLFFFFIDFRKGNKILLALPQCPVETTGGIAWPSIYALEAANAPCPTNSSVFVDGEPQASIIPQRECLLSTEGTSAEWQDPSHLCESVLLTSLFSPFLSYLILLIQGIIRCPSQIYWNASWSATYVTRKATVSCLPGFAVYENNQPNTTAKPERPCQLSQDGTFGIWEDPSTQCEGFFFFFFFFAPHSSSSSFRIFNHRRKGRGEKEEEEGEREGKKKKIFFKSDMRDLAMPE